jgi:ribosome-binding factor A
MESTRQHKISRLIQKELAEYFQRESKLFFSNRMITVTMVRVTSDLSIARVYLSIFPAGKDKDMLGVITNHSKTIRSELAKKVRYQLRKVPELSFFLDDSLDYADNIDRLLHS